MKANKVKDGKNIERLIKLIHESLKEIPNTRIYPNHRIKNTSGRKREIDLYVSCQLQNLEINIAIECKDYERAVSVKEIEAFYSKCLRIKGISKLVFVTTNGYQADAFDAANEFGIILYNFNEISPNDIFSWFSVSLNQLKLIIKVKLPLRVTFIGKKSDLLATSDEKELVVHYYKNDEAYLMSHYVWNTIVVSQQNEIRGITLYNFMKNGSESDKRSEFPFELETTEIYIIGEKNKKIPVASIKSEIVSWYEIHPVEIIQAKSYQKIGEEPESIGMHNDSTADMVLANNKLSVFYNKDGQTHKLKLLGKYNPKTDTFTNIKKNGK